MSEWDKVIEDTTAAVNLDSMYVKALNRRANAYEHLEMYSEALLDYTASCIIDKFQNRQSAEAVERLLEKVAKKKAEEIFSSKDLRLPSPAFVSNYLQSFRPKPPPVGLEETADLPEDSGKGQIKKGILGIQRRDADGYAEADQAFIKALELGDLGEHEAYALNMRATFRWLKGQVDEAMEDINKSIELDPSYTQSYIKRASMHTEKRKTPRFPSTFLILTEAVDKAAAMNDFKTALQYNPGDPDIYYHRAQLNFVDQQFQEASADYQKSIDLDKDFIFSHIQLGVTQYKQGSIASSMATFRKCIKNFEKVPDVYNYYGELLLDQQQYQKAIENFDTAIDLEKSLHPTGINVLPIINKALTKFQWKQDFAEAKELCHKALISKCSSY
jgi:import receptor subunit TOM70